MAASRFTPSGWVQETGSQARATPTGWVQETVSGGGATTLPTLTNPTLVAAGGNNYYPRVTATYS